MWPVSPYPVFFPVPLSSRPDDGAAQQVAVIDQLFCDLPVNSVFRGKTNSTFFAVFAGRCPGRFSAKREKRRAAPGSSVSLKGFVLRLAICSNSQICPIAARCSSHGKRPIKGAGKSCKVRSLPTWLMYRSIRSDSTRMVLVPNHPFPVADPCLFVVAPKADFDLQNPFGRKSGLLLHLPGITAFPRRTNFNAAKLSSASWLRGSGREDPAAFLHEAKELGRHGTTPGNPG